jgi:coronin-7
MRQRQFSIYDPRSLSSPVKQKSLDVNTSSLIPIADRERSIVWFGGRGDMRINWVEGNGGANEGSIPLITPITSLAISPPSNSILNVMRGEIDKLYVTCAEGVIPIIIQVPKRVRGFTAPEYIFRLTLLSAIH